MKRQINEQNSFSLENVSKTEPKLLGSTTTLKCLLYSPLPHSPPPPPLLWEKPGIDVFPSCCCHGPMDFNDLFGPSTLV